jgi:phosphomannomutase/phosphoglucomutase
MEIVAGSDRPLSEQFAGLPKTVTTPEIRFDCPDEAKFEVVRRSAAELRARYATVDVDGVRVLFPEGWGLVRASNTQPVLVMRFEATTPALLARYREEVENVVAASVETVRAAGTGRR